MQWCKRAGGAGVAEPSRAACVGVSPSHSCWVKWGRWEFASHPLGMPGGKGGCAWGKHIWCLDDAIPAMNQKNSFAAMTGRGLGHSPKCMSQEQPSHGGRLSCFPARTPCCTALITPGCGTLATAAGSAQHGHSSEKPLGKLLQFPHGSSGRQTPRPR